MNRIIFKSRVSDDGILHLNVPLGSADADREVQVTVEPIPFAPVPDDEWRQFILSTAGKWLGEFERPEQGRGLIARPTVLPSSIGVLS